MAAQQEAAEHKSFKKGAALAELLQNNPAIAQHYASLSSAGKTAALQQLHKLRAGWSAAGKAFDAGAALEALRGLGRNRYVCGMEGVGCVSVRGGGEGRLGCVCVCMCAYVNTHYVLVYWYYTCCCHTV